MDTIQNERLIFLVHMDLQMTWDDALVFNIFRGCACVHACLWWHEHKVRTRARARVCAWCPPWSCSSPVHCQVGHATAASMTVIIKVTVLVTERKSILLQPDCPMAAYKTRTGGAHNH